MIILKPLQMLIKKRISCHAISPNNTACRSVPSRVMEGNDQYS